MFIFPLFVFEFIQTKETPLERPLSIHINVQLDIEKGDDGSIRITSTQPIVRKPPTRQMGFLTSSPAPGATVQVRLNSSSAFGSICAWAQYSTPVYMVKALVYPLNQYPLVPPDQPPDASVAGISWAYGTIWQWTDGNMVPGADHSATGQQNVIAFWYQDQTGWNFDQGVQFTGIDSLSGPCPPLPFSGLTSETVRSLLQPSILVGESLGFHGPHAIFNSLFALRKTSATTWNNQGDGNSTPEISLTYDAEQKKWTLLLKFQRTSLTLATHSCLMMGPLVFNLSAGSATAVSSSPPRVRISPNI